MPEISANKICIIRLSALGDTVHTLGMINGLRRIYPEAHLAWILQPISYELVKHQDNIDRFILFDRSKGLKSWRKLAKDLNKEKFDLVLMLQVSIKSSLISTIVRGDVKLGFDFRRSREMHWMFANQRIPHRLTQHAQAQYLEFLDYLGLEDYSGEWNFRFTEQELAWRKDFFEELGRPAISFVVATSNSHKDWHASGYAQVMDYIDKNLDMQPMIVGGPGKQERAMAHEICRLCESHPVVDLGDSLRQTMLQLSGSLIAVSPDTGPLHIAVALNVPTVSLFGYSNPRRCGPFNRFQDLLVDRFTDSGEENIPITRATKKGRMALISPEEVIEKIELGLERYVRK
ncbi:MAG: glycosyltransferase family 9 protein [Deltaproteobacteria bacterium]|nr:glycosyltransferase family 9 protein [Deltaproteobacteria bacterium]